jgi:hypothetical protein
MVILAADTAAGCSERSDLSAVRLNSSTFPPLLIPSWSVACGRDSYAILVSHSLAPPERLNSFDTRFYAPQGLAAAKSSGG